MVLLQLRQASLQHIHQRTSKKRSGGIMAPERKQKTA
jgi:hypothetical protein